MTRSVGEAAVRGVRFGMSVVVLVVCGAVWCASIADAAPREPDRHRLLVIGDSIILGTGDHIAANLTDWDVVFDAAVSRSTAAGLEALGAHGTDFSVVVVALGANDGETPGVFTPRVAALLDALDGVPHVVWLTIHEARPYYAQTNAIIADQVARHDNAIVGDWNAAVRPGDVADDGLHLTGQGSVAMADWVAAVARLVVVPPPTTTTSTTTTSTTTTSTTTTTTTTPPATTTKTVRVAHPPDTGTAPDDSGFGSTAVIVAALGVPAAAVVLLGWFGVRRRRRDAERSPTEL